MGIRKAQVTFDIMEQLILGKTKPFTTDLPKDAHIVSYHFVKPRIIVAIIESESFGPKLDIAGIPEITITCTPCVADSA